MLVVSLVSINKYRLSFKTHVGDQVARAQDKPVNNKRVTVGKCYMQKRVYFTLNAIGPDFVFIRNYYN